MQTQSYFIYSMNNIEIIASIKNHAQTVFENLTTDELVNKALERKEGRITSQGALAADTGEFTGRSPKEDRKSTRLNSSHEWISRMPSSA